MQVLRDSSEVIEEYLTVMRREINPSKEYERLTRSVLSKIDVSTATQTDIIKFLDSLRKPEAVDPMHKWIGSYNLYVAILKRFFKWFNNPYCMEGIKKLKRKEVSIYKPSDLWTQEDDLLFLKFCPSKRDKCYHMISRDTSCRRSEILKIKCKEICFKMIGNKQYAEVLVNGKTGSRQIPLINSLPYIKDYLDNHVADPNSYLIRSKKFSKLNSSSLNVIYTKYKEEYFPRLLKDPNVSQEDKDAIRDLLAKPWNPYIRRHSALTEKSKILKEHILRSHAGWSSRSNMPERYLHYFGNESSESILVAYGLKPSAQELDKLSPVQCPNCGEGNRQQSRFCAKCRMILSYDTYLETVEQKEEQTRLNLEIRNHRDTQSPPSTDDTQTPTTDSVSDSSTSSGADSTTSTTDVGTSTDSNSDSTSPESTTDQSTTTDSTTASTGSTVDSTERTNVPSASSSESPTSSAANEDTQASSEPNSITAQVADSPERNNRDLERQSSDELQSTDTNTRIQNAPVSDSLRNNRTGDTSTVERNHRTSEDLTVKNIVAMLTIKRIPDLEIIKSIFDQTGKTTTVSNLTRIKQEIKRDSYQWYKIMREGEYEYIHEFRERINEILDLQKRHYEIADCATVPIPIKQASLFELHKLSVTLSNLFDVAPYITSNSNATLSTPSGTKTTGSEAEEPISYVV